MLIPTDTISLLNVNISTRPDQWFGARFASQTMKVFDVPDSWHYTARHTFFKFFFFTRNSSKIYENKLIKIRIILLDHDCNDYVNIKIDFLQIIRCTSND